MREEDVDSGLSIIQEYCHIPSWGMNEERRRKKRFLEKYVEKEENNLEKELEEEEDMVE